MRAVMIGGSERRLFIEIVWRARELIAGQSMYIGRIPPLYM
jgi:hypothetical protein